MKDSNKYRTKKFIYNFMYPSIAGSMLYGAINHISTFYSLWSLSALLIIIMMALDYWHLNFDLLSNAPNERKWLNLIIDACIPVLYALALHMFTVEKVGVMATFLVIITGVQLFYPSFGIKFKCWYVLSKLLLFISALLIFFNY